MRERERGNHNKPTTVSMNHWQHECELILGGCWRGQFFADWLVHHQQFKWDMGSWISLWVLLNPRGKSSPFLLKTSRASKHTCIKNVLPHDVNGRLTGSMESKEDMMALRLILSTGWHWAGVFTLRSR